MIKLILIVVLLAAAIIVAEVLKDAVKAAVAKVKALLSPKA